MGEMIFYATLMQLIDELPSLPFYTVESVIGAKVSLVITKQNMSI